MSNGYSLSDGIDSDDPRQDKWTKQREERGFDDTELWNLDGTISKFITPRLKAFKEKASGYPSDLTEEVWNEYLDDMIFAFEKTQEEIYFEESDAKRIHRGLKLFAKYYLNLWD